MLQTFFDAFVGEGWMSLREIDYLTPEEREAFEGFLIKLLFRRDHTEYIQSSVQPALTGSKIFGTWNLELVQFNMADGRDQYVFEWDAEKEVTVTSIKVDAKDSFILDSRNLYAL